MAVARTRIGTRDRTPAARTVPLSDVARSLVPIGLLSVVLGVPLVVLWEASGPYDDPKAWALPILAMMTGLAWLWRAGNGFPGTSSSDLPSRVLGWIVLASLVWTAITTVTSVAPIQSVVGTFGRGMGLLTVGSATLLFFVIRSECRTSDAVRLLVDAALLGSVPVCLLALGQAVGWDPLPKSWDPAVASLTVRSTFGSHLFLGSYLVVLAPLTLARLGWMVRGRAESGGWPRPTRAEWRRALVSAAWAVGAVSLIGLASQWSIVWWALVPWGVAGAIGLALPLDRRNGTNDTTLTAGCLAALLAAQVLVVILSRGRGAFIGMLVGLAVTSWGFLFRRRAWKGLVGVALALAGVAAFVVLLNLPESPIASLRDLPLLRRLSQITDLKYESPGWFRLQVWRGILDSWRRQLHGEETFPGLSPRARSFIGYGTETQLVVLDPLTAPFVGTLMTETETWRARYIADRAHNYVLDHLVTEGLVGAGLYLLVVGGVVWVGILRIRRDRSAGEFAIRLGALGAVSAHVADGQVGIATSMSLTLFWVVAALLTNEPWRLPAGPSRSSPWRVAGTRWWTLCLVCAAGLAAFTAWTSTRWLFASIAYADGARHAMAGRMAAAHQSFRSSVDLAPWLPLPAESAALAGLRLAGGELDPARQRSLLQEAAAILERARRHAVSGAGTWTLTGQVALARARAGERSELALSRDAFAAALRLRPGDPALLAQLALVWLESGDPSRARQFAEEAVRLGPEEWLAWAVLARAARDVGEPAVAREAAEKAREFAPPEVETLVKAMLR